MQRTQKPRVACQGEDVRNPDMTPAVDGRRQVEAVLRVQLGLPLVGHGILITVGINESFQ
jgi:hypothetical protein